MSASAAFSCGTGPDFLVACCQTETVAIDASWEIDSSGGGSSTGVREGKANHIMGRMFRDKDMDNTFLESIAGILGTTPAEFYEDSNRTPHLPAIVFLLRLA